MKKIIHFSCAGLCLLVLGIAGCAEKGQTGHSPFTAIGGTNIALKEGLSPTILEKYKKQQQGTMEERLFSSMQLYGITTENFMETRTALQYFLAENPEPVLEYVATRLCDKTPLVILWSKETKNGEKQQSIQEYLLTQGVAKVDTEFFKNTLKQESQGILKSKKNNPSQTSSYALLFHKFEKRNQEK